MTARLATELLGRDVARRRSLVVREASEDCRVGREEQQQQLKCGRPRVEEVRRSEERKGKSRRGLSIEGAGLACVHSYLSDGSRALKVDTAAPSRTAPV